MPCCAVYYEQMPIRQANVNDKQQVAALHAAAYMPSHSACCLPRGTTLSTMTYTYTVSLP